MWSRRAQEYEAKINSGDLISIAEVVRDLHRAENQPEQSYSERQLYESALDRMAREVAAIERIDREAAIGILTKSLVKTPPRLSYAAISKRPGFRSGGVFVGPPQATAGRRAMRSSTWAWVGIRAAAWAQAARRYCRRSSSWRGSIRSAKGS